MAQALAGRRAVAAGRKARTELVRVTDLTGGLDRRVSPTQMAPERARRLRNARLAVAGEWQPRPGWTSWLLTSMGSGRAQGAQRIYLDGVAPFTLAAHTGSVYKPSDGGVLGASVLGSLNTTNQIFFPYDADLVAVFDGANVPKKSVDGTTWTQLGISAPTVAPTVTAPSAGGSLVNGNTYEFSYSYEDEAGLGHGSNEGPTQTIVIGATNRQADVSCPFSADPQVDQIYVYARDVSAGEEVRRFAGQVANPGSGSASVVVSANTWSAEIEAPTRRNVPPALDFGVAWKNRWWARDAADETRIRFTEIFENQSWPTNYFIDVPFTRGDRIAAIVPLGDVLVILGQSKQAFLIIGQTSLDFEVRPSAAVEAGALGPRAVDVVEQGILHAAAQGVYLFDGATDRLLTYDLEFDWRDLIESSSEAQLERVPLVYHRRDKEVRIAVPLIAAYGSAGEFVLDLARTRAGKVPAWATTDRPIGGYLQWDGVESTTGNQGRIFAWADTVGQVYEESTGTSANGANLVADYEGPEFSVGLQMARFTHLFVEFEPNDGAFGLEIRCDGVTVLQPSISIQSGLSRYGSATYGSSGYGGASRTQIPIELPLEAEGRNIQIIGQYEGKATFKWFTYGIHVIVEPEIRGL